MNLTSYSYDSAPRNAFVAHEHDCYTHMKEKYFSIETQFFTKCMLIFENPKFE